MNRAEFENKLSKLEFTVDNLHVYRKLLRLPYKEYKPLIEMLLNKQITPEDFMDSSGVINDISVDTAKEKIKANSKQVSSNDVKTALLDKNSGKDINTNKLIPYDYDHKGNVASSDNYDKNLPYLVNGKTVVSDGSFESIIPNKIQIFKAGSIGLAKKIIQKELNKRRLNK